MIDIENQVAEILDRMGVPYVRNETPHTDEVCALCGLSAPDFQVNGRYFHFECEFPNGGTFR